MTSHTGGQKHFYLEPQTTLAVPTEDGKLSLYTSSQAPADTHTLVSKARVHTLFEAVA